MFCNKKIQNTIDPIQNRSVQIIFSESALNLDELVELDKDTAIHRKTSSHYLLKFLKQPEEKNQA